MLKVACELPLTRELADVFIAPLRVDNLDLVVAIQKGQVGLAPGPVGELRRGHSPKRVRRLELLARAV